MFTGPESPAGCIIVSICLSLYIYVCLYLSVLIYVYIYVCVCVQQDQTDLEHRSSESVWINTFDKKVFLFREARE